MYSQPKGLMPPALPPKPVDEIMTTVLVGSKQRSFKVNRQLLCAVSPFFRSRLQNPTSKHDEGISNANATKPVSLWLPGESASMFSLFVQWLHARDGFRSFLEDCVDTANDNGPAALRDLQWTIIRLHLFASHLSLHQLQDLAMDAIQDMYLKFDWDVAPDIITYLYTECDPIPAVRLRRFAAAMVAFSLAGDDKNRSDRRRSAIARSSLAVLDQAEKQEIKAHVQGDRPLSQPSSQFQDLFDMIPDFAADYAMHMRKMNASGLDIRFKNPQLRIYANRLRNDERSFGFRQCSFHSHRASVGERQCPHHREKRVPKPVKPLLGPGRSSFFSGRFSRGSGMLLETVEESTAKAVTMEPGSARTVAVGHTPEVGYNRGVPRTDTPEDFPHHHFSELSGEYAPPRYTAAAADRPERRSFRERLVDMPQPLFSELSGEPSLRHVRSVSSTLR